MRNEPRQSSGSLQRRRGVVVSYVYTAAQAIVQLIYVPLLLSCIGQDEYGLYQLVGSIISYLVSINGVLSSGISRYYCVYRAEGDYERADNVLAISSRIYWFMSVVALVACAVLAEVAGHVYRNSFTPEQVLECQIMLMVLGVNSIITMHNTVSIAAITAHERFVFLKGSQLATLLLQPILVLVLAGVFHNALCVTVVILLMNLLAAALQKWYSATVLNVRPRYKGWDRSIVRALFGFSAAVVLATVADQIFWKTDQLIIGYVYNASAVAVYSIGSQIYMAYMQLGLVASSVFLPKVSLLWKDGAGVREVSDLFARVGRIAFIVCFFVLGGFLVLGPDFITMWAGPQYAESYLVAAVIMVPFTIDLIQNLGITILMVADKYYFRGAMYLVIAIFNVVTTIILLQLLGIVGAAISTAVAMFIGNGLIMNWYYSKKLGLSMRLYWSQVLRLLLPLLPVLAVFAWAYWALPVPHGTWGAFILAGILYMLAYCSALWKFGFNSYERALVGGLLRRIGVGK